ncbi:MAG: flagellar export protein FliJ [Candidatus Sericytochromatia bacterium]|nr:flagellar export protein FliJ [Candidatus Tanganyikabacteria bacterium]
MPKRFKFRLEAVLKHRKQVEDEKAGALGRAVLMRQEAEAALQAVLDAQTDLNRKRAELQHSGRFTAMDLEEHVRYLSALQAKEVERRRHLERQRQAEEAARQELVLARQEREVLDRLRENQHLEYLKELDAADAKLIDELATQAHARKILGIERSGT